MLIAALPLGDYEGVVQIPETQVPADARAFRAAVARCTEAMPEVWPAPTQIEVMCEGLRNGEWVNLGGFTAIGGRHIHFRGHELTASHDQSKDIEGITHIRGVVTFEAPARTEVVLQFFDEPPPRALSVR